ncbi:putative gene 9922 [Cricetulus griseus]|uniref:Uncharacterized protein n=1 Tax=Cricetulus griseus TaxID=10029 RepID=A0A8C2LHT0_CRIGR
MLPSPHPSRLCQPSPSQAPGRRCPYSLRPGIPGIAAHNCTFPGQETSPAGTRSRLASPSLPSGSTQPADPSLKLRSPRDLPGFRPQVTVTAWALAAPGPLAWAGSAPPGLQLGPEEEPCRFTFTPSLQEVR